MIERRNASWGAEIFDGTVDELIAGAPSMREPIAAARAAALSGANVVITGESGVGKQTVAAAIHRSRPSPRGPLVIIAGPAIPRSFEYDELVSVVGTRPSPLDEARGGTLVVSYASALTQGVLRELAHAQRSMAARSTSVAQMILTYERREMVDPELMRVLEPIGIVMPPLRERMEDLPAFIELFCPYYSAREGTPEMSLGDAARGALAGMEFGGNVRELACRIWGGIARARWDGRSEVIPSDL